MIRHLARVTLAAAALLLSGAVGFAQKTYVQESLASDAIRLEAQIKTQAGTPAPGRSAQHTGAMPTRRCAQTRAAHLPT